MSYTVVDQKSTVGLRLALSELASVIGYDICTYMYIGVYYIPSTAMHYIYLISGISEK